MIKLFEGLLRSRHYVKHFTSISSNCQSNRKRTNHLFSSARRCSAGVGGAGGRAQSLEPPPTAPHPSRRPRLRKGGPGVGGSQFPAGPRPWALPSAAPARSACRRASPADVRSLPSRRSGPEMRAYPGRASSRCVRRT